MAGKRPDRHDESLNALVNAIKCPPDEPEEKGKKRRMGFVVEKGLARPPVRRHIQSIFI